MAKRRPNNKYFDRGLKRWIIQTARRNHWRVSSYIDLEDLIAEGHMAYVICRSRYQVSNQRHFMGLCKIVFINRITDMANERSRGDAVPISQLALPGQEEGMMELLAGGADGEAELLTTLGSLPDQIAAFLNMFNTPEGLDCLNRPCRRQAGGMRETTAQKVSRHLGIAPADFETMLRTVLEVPG